MLELIDMYNFNQPVKLYFVNLMNCITFTFNEVAGLGEIKVVPFVSNDDWDYQ